MNSFRLHGSWQVDVPLLFKRELALCFSLAFHFYAKFSYFLMLLIFSMNLKEARNCSSFISFSQIPWFFVVSYKYRLTVSSALPGYLSKLKSRLRAAACQSDAVEGCVLVHRGKMRDVPTGSSVHVHFAKCQLQLQNARHFKKCSPFWKYTEYFLIAGKLSFF